MNLSQYFFRGRKLVPQVNGGPENASSGHQEAKAQAALRPADTIFGAASAPGQVGPNPTTSIDQSDPRRSIIVAPISDPVLQRFFEENFFGFGLHNGVHYRSAEALDLQQKAIISRFQNLLTSLIVKKQAQVDRIQSELLTIAGVSDTTSRRLSLAAEQLQRDLAALLEQVALAGERSGWVSEALLRYASGYARGVREAVEFAFLTGADHGID